MKSKEDSKDKTSKSKSKKIFDYTSFVTPKAVHSDPGGSYTGTTADTFYGSEYEDPVQDADDL